MNMEEEVEGTNRTNRNGGVTRRKDTLPPLTRLDGRSSASRRHRPRPEGAVEAAWSRGDRAVSEGKGAVECRP